MLSNKELSRVFRLASQLLELHDENPFRIRSLQNVSFRLEKHPEPLASIPGPELEAIEGIGKSTAAKIVSIASNGSFDELDEILKKTPAGVVSLLSIKGLGPKKVRALWKELGIESVGELLYACNENRLVELKGFGAKTQEQVRKAIEYAISNEGKFHYADVEMEATRLLHHLEENQAAGRISFTGALRRKCEVLECAELLATDERWSHLLQCVASFLEGKGGQKEESDRLHVTTAEGVPISIKKTTSACFEEALFHSTGSSGHFEWLEKIKPGIAFKGEDETAIYRSLGLPYFEPEFREGLFEEQWLSRGTMPTTVEYGDLLGTLHNHSTYSDGMHSLEEMAAYCQSMGFRYLGICDHSQSAFYANGLQPDRVLKQHDEIDRLNARMAPFRIFKGIESDILNDGSLDYHEDLLSQFDFIVASIHSVLRMDKDRATSRIIKAVEHPRTTILGHPTGRLLLAREGYPLDMEKVIDACAANGVVIELNANPYRLDLDWRHIPYALEKGVMISINPDAHRKEGYHDMHYGVCVARKGGLTKDMTFNCLDAQQVEEHFKKRK